MSLTAGCCACLLEHHSSDDEPPAHAQLPPTVSPHAMSCLRWRKQQEVLQFSAYFVSGRLAEQGARFHLSTAHRLQQEHSELANPLKKESFRMLLEGKTAGRGRGLVCGVQQKGAQGFLKQRVLEVIAMDDSLWSGIFLEESNSLQL